MDKFPIHSQSHINWLEAVDNAYQRVCDAKDRLRYFCNNDPDLFGAEEETELRIDVHLAENAYERVQLQEPPAFNCTDQEGAQS